MNQWIAYFARRPLVTNFVLFGTVAAAVLFWGKLGKEEMPDFEMNWLRATIRYPGAAAEDVEALITRPIEEQLKGVSGLEEVSSTSAFGSASFRIIFSPDLGNDLELVQEIKDAVARAVLPEDAEEPVYRRFTSAEKAIIDIALIHTGTELLNVEQRAELQGYALAFENRLLALNEVSGLEKQGYLKPELQISIHPEKLRQFDISLAEVRNQIRTHNVRVPVGTMEDREESELTVISELEDVESLNKLVVRGGFEGQKVYLRQLATVRHGFADSNTILKVQGHEAIIYSVQKSGATDILSAQRAVMKFVEEFRSAHRDSPVRIVPMDDESYDVRNRLSLIGTNGLMGFLLIVIILFIFLDFKSGLWVAMGIPFTLAFTLVAAMIIGYTVNNMTLAAIIIVLGIVVDDAIIVAEHVSRLHHRGMPLKDAVVEGTRDMMGPITASVLTTCAAFLPLYFFSGRFGMLVQYIPTIIFLMLGASLLESAFILPGHLLKPLPRFWWGRGSRAHVPLEESREHWIFRVEAVYARVLSRFLGHRVLVVLGFTALLAGSAYLFVTEFRFVMFPREEATSISVRVTAPPDTTRVEMARKVRAVEDIFLADPEFVTSVRSSVAQSRRGGAVRDNEASVRVELFPPSERRLSLRELLARWEAKTAELEGFQEIRFMRSRFGSESGSPIEIEIQENNDSRRAAIAEMIRTALSEHQALTNAEIERPVTRNEYRLLLRQDEVIRLGVNPTELASAMRAYVEGQVLYTITSGDEEVDVRLTSEAENKKRIESVLGLLAANTSSYLVPFRNLVEVVPGKKPANIQRINFKRSIRVYADLKEGTEMTPLEIAESLETSLFPEVIRKYPSSVIQFRGEVEDSRESQGDFLLSIVGVIGLIYFLLVVLFDSLGTPLLIAAVIPFGAVGVILAFWLHGMVQYGFFAMVGTLGMIGVVVNDAIVMISALESETREGSEGESVISRIARIASTRFRPVLVTTLTTVAGLFPTAYGLGGYDSMLAEMMLAMGWGLVFATGVTLLLVPCLYTFYALLGGRRREAVA